ncbi:MAG: HD domain-containing protein, partial [Acidaminococcaceae bacterium]
MPEVETVLNIEDFFKKISQYLSPEQIAIVKRAYELAAEAHAAQRRASGEPYIIHPLGVATILAHLQLDELTLAAAFLHDVVEDTDISLEKITEMFGEKVAALVDGVTKLSKIEYISKEEQQVEN